MVLIINSKFYFILIFITGFILGSIWNIPYKYIVIKIFGDEYKDLVYQCDYVMKDHYLAKSKVMLQPNKESLKNLEQAEFSLIHCHEYDKFRKKLLSLGLDEVDLSYLGLEIIEEKQIDINEIVDIHEIKQK